MLQIQNDGLSARCELKIFNKWILEIGDETNSVPNDDTQPKYPKNLFFHLVKEIYLYINSHLHDIDYFIKRAMLSTKVDTLYLVSIIIYQMLLKVMNL